MTYTRRHFGKLALTSLPVAAAAVAYPSSLFAQGKVMSTFGGVKLGCITAYSYHGMPETAADILKYLVRDGIAFTEMERTQENFAGAPPPPPRPANFAPLAPGQERPKPTPEAMAAQKKYRDDLLAWRISTPMDKFVELRKMYNNAGVQIYGFKVQLDNTMPDAAFDYAFNGAKACGANQVTMEMPEDGAMTKRMGDFATKHKIWVGYHAHLQAAPTTWDDAMSQSAYNGINLDIGHFIAAGNSPDDLLAFIKKNHARITSMHVKDRKSKANGGMNQPWGMGDTPIKDVLLLMKKEQYKFPATIELEYQPPAGSDSEKEIVKSVAYAKQVLTA